ncbi:restriction endonuclease subunit S [Lactiplantibacillus plantarum]|uniref:restriction endonuclease subunit S n=1 Tax=Lactiplantibacillus plantarum TaxID=1590 RepID=UPI001F4BD5ED|nr:restriction endonuclease subunit S [Lactiplantibacillus plantarum]UNB88137.1 restriction endonuclease subunit S [Lactiplantibacillus plantarum]
MKNENLVPKVRFKGFSDPWEQRKLGELFNERKEKSSQGELLSVTINSGIVKFDTLDRKNNSSADKSNYRVVRYGDIAYNSMRMWQGASGLSMYNGIVSPAYTVITPRTNTDAGFMAVNFKRKSMIQVFQRNSQGLTSDTWNLKFPVLKNIRISIPKITEQQIITELFTVINNLIAANEDKLEQLKTLKKLMMQKIFSQEWRFKGFTDPWEQRKLKDVSMIGSASRVHQGDWREHGIRFLRSSDIVKMSNREIVRNRIFIEKKLFNKLSAETGSPKTDDVLITGGGSIGTAYRITDDSPIYFKDADVLWIRTKNINGKFLVSYFKTNIFRKYLHSIAHIGTISHYTIIQLKNTPIQLPAYSEQNRIGDCFVTLNSLIAANEDKLNQLKKLKKYLMRAFYNQVSQILLAN